MISIIIPTLNEAHVLPLTLASIRANPTPCEIIVVDGGSTDGTLEQLPETIRPFRSTTPHRSAQMNQGAAVALGDTLLFLHADTRLLATSLQQIEMALSDPRVVGGAFARQFETQSRFLAVTCCLASLRGAALGWFLGDQGIFARRQVFEELRGYAPIFPFEDLDFSRRLAHRGRTRLLRPGIISSARRFDRLGPVRRTIRDFFLTCQYFLRHRNP